MRKALIFTVALAAMTTASALAVAGFQKNRVSRDLFNQNVEALTDSEIIVGGLCMQCPNHACTSLGEVYLDNYPA